MFCLADKVVKQVGEGWLSNRATPSSFIIGLNSLYGKNQSCRGIGIGIGIGIGTWEPEFLKGATVRPYGRAIWVFERKHAQFNTVLPFLVI